MALHALQVAVVPDDGDGPIGDVITEHGFKVLLTFVVVIIYIDMVETKGEVMTHPLTGILVLAPTDGYKCCLHKRFLISLRMVAAICSISFTSLLSLMHSRPLAF